MRNTKNGVDCGRVLHNRVWILSIIDYQTKRFRDGKSLYRHTIVATGLFQFHFILPLAVATTSTTTLSPRHTRPLMDIEVICECRRRFTRWPLAARSELLAVSLQDNIILWNEPGPSSTCPRNACISTQETPAHA